MSQPDTPTKYPVRETYLGDGVYASFDGWQIKLRTMRDLGDEIIYLEPAVFAALEAYGHRVFALGTESGGS